MHMADALLSTPVALIGGAAAASLIVIAGNKIKQTGRDNMVPLMGVMGAFVFAAQMVNFSIPGTGSSGHIVGGVLLAALLGPWAAFLTLTSVLIIQCLVFADGGLMALGCNIINMAAMSALVAYPLIFKPLMKGKISSAKIVLASVLACVIGLETGALLVTVETKLSGVTALPGREFLLLMTSIHLPIGLIEGLATAAVLVFVEKTRPDLIITAETGKRDRKPLGKVIVGFAVAALIVAGGLAFLASSNPDGLEWSISQIVGTAEPVANDVSAVRAASENLQQATAVLPDYENSFSGIIGAVLVLAVVVAFASMLTRARRKSVKV